MPIRVLDAATIGRIAAGEVVERPASIAKELIENSLDAGATAITVEIRGGGAEYLRVADNGCGMPPEEVRLAFENHATSKIQSGDQLSEIGTLGFRGEALPSISAVSRVTMTTRQRGRDSGVKIALEGGRVLEVGDAGCPEGTTVIVRDLFFNVPVRRAFLKRPATEAGAVMDAVAKLILGNPKVGIRLIHAGRTIYHSYGSGDARHAAMAVYGRDVAEKLKWVDVGEGGLRLRGLIGIGELSRSSRSHQSFFINGRVVRCPLLSDALEEAVRGRTMIGQYPMCALALELPPSSVDINVHPNKLEVRFRDEVAVYNRAAALLTEAMGEGERMLDPAAVLAPPQLPPNERVVRVEPGGDTKQTEVSITQTEVGNKQTLVGEDPTLVASERRVPQSRVVEVPDASGRLVLREFPSIPDTYVAAARQAEPEQTQLLSDARPDEPALRVIGVYAGTYILAELGDALIMIDQHAAHERILYERYERQAASASIMQPLLAPLILPMSPTERAQLMDNRDVLLDAGYDVEPFGERDVQVRAVPYVLGQAQLKPVFMEFLNRLGALRGAARERRRSELVIAACKHAVKAGDALTIDEINGLIAAMRETGAPPNCPHGRPVLKVFRKSEVESMFRRI
ncbi:MAG: DNA mismatch repair endonuclease MutL [Clostridiales bacterium]|nr:DNA mismatch repair endonuclease MutL [Clostridiales bacterium]